MIDPEYTNRLRAALDGTRVLRQDQRDLFQSCDSLQERTNLLWSELRWYRSAVDDSVRRLRRTRNAIATRLGAQRPPWHQSCGTRPF
jgi:hypothetical protein